MPIFTLFFIFRVDNFQCICIRIQRKKSARKSLWAHTIHHFLAHWFLTVLQRICMKIICKGTRWKTKNPFQALLIQLSIGNNDSPHFIGEKFTWKISTSAHEISIRKDIKCSKEIFVLYGHFSVGKRTINVKLIYHVAQRHMQ